MKELIFTSEETIEKGKIVRPSPMKVFIKKEKNDVIEEIKDSVTDSVRSHFDESIRLSEFFAALDSSHKLYK